MSDRFSVGIILIYGIFKVHVTVASKHWTAKIELSMPKVSILSLSLCSHSPSLLLHLLSL